MRSRLHRWLGTPALLLLYAVLVAAAVPFLLREGWDDVWSVRALAASDRCAGGDCVREVDGTLRGPFSRRRTVNDEWSLVDAVGGHHHFDLGPRASSRLRGGDLATALVYRDDVVAVVTTSGTQVRTLDGGAHDATVVGSWAVAAASAAPLLVWQGRRRRRARGGWWRTGGGEATGPAPLPVAALSLVAIAAGCTFVATAFGAVWWLALLVGGGFVGASGVVAVRRARRGSA